MTHQAHPHCTRPATPPPTQPNTPAFSSTPVAPPVSSNSKEPSSSRASHVDNALSTRNCIRFETDTNPSILDQFVSGIPERYGKITELEAVLEMAEQFINTADKSRQNENELSLVVGAVTREVRSNTGCNSGFVHSGAKPMGSRDSNDLSSEHKGRGLKPDFFTSRIEFDETGNGRPISLSAVLAVATSVTEISQSRRSNRLASRYPNASVGGSSSSSYPDPLVLPNDGSFTWEDVRILVELKSSSKEINSSSIRSNLILKAAAVLRAQWYRRFVIAIVICGTKVRMMRFDRSGVLVGNSIDFTEGRGVLLIKCVLACLVASPPDIGLPTDLEDPTTTVIDGVCRLVVKVRDHDIVLGDKIASPPPDYLVGRGTVVHKARQCDGVEWDLVHKISWPYEARQHEGLILQELQDVEGVVRLIAWDVPVVEGMLEGADILRDFPIATPPNDVFHSRQLRQTVTSYIPESLSQSHSVLTLLNDWRSLYQVVDRIGKKGWVHRDLSWDNVRLTHPPGDERLSITLIDFDLASRITGPTSGSPERTGTIAFMPIPILLSSETRHQELNEDEAVFWIGFLASISRTKCGSNEVANLYVRGQTLEDLGLKKAGIVSPMGRTRWRGWFGDGPDAAILMKVCVQIWAELESLYSPLSEVDKNGKSASEVGKEGESKQEIQHGKFVQKAEEIFDQGIEQAMELDPKEKEQALTLQPAHHK
ncbi:MAG: hypothetical protein M1840_001692 [Geoglossum simile]|nr:MAG: hypothetical protein M1840_001692 [Geoglossum simile]